MVHRVGDVEKVFPEFAGDVLIRRILARQLQGDGEEVESIHGHPARAIRLLDVSASRQRSAAIEHADVVEAQETSLENVFAFGVLAVDPPREIQQQLVKDLFEKLAIPDATSF